MSIRWPKGLRILCAWSSPAALQIQWTLRTAEQIARIGKLREELKLSPMDNPYEYVKASQTHFDGSQIPYSDAYYDILGQER